MGDKSIMLAKFLPLAVTAFLSVGVLAQEKPPSCALDKKCPKSAPCCSREFLSSPPTSTY